MVLVVHLLHSMAALYIYSAFLDKAIEDAQKRELEAEQLAVQLEYEANRNAAGKRDYIPMPPYKGNIEGYLGAILLGGTILGYEELFVDESAVVTLTVPDKAKKAVLVVEADESSSNLKKVMRYQIGPGVTPTDTTGMPISDESVFEIGTLWNLTNFKIIGIEAGKTHKITVEYQG